MKKFIKGNLVSVVEDDDRRIADYRKGGWKEEAIKATAPADAADQTLDKAMKDVTASEPAKSGKKKGKEMTPPNKKVNDAIKANTTAITESEAVDDGLTPQEGE